MWSCDRIVCDRKKFLWIWPMVTFDHTLGAEWEQEEDPGPSLFHPPPGEGGEDKVEEDWDQQRETPGKWPPKKTWTEKNPGKITRGWADGQKQNYKRLFGPCLPAKRQVDRLSIVKNRVPSSWREVDGCADSAEKVFREDISSETCYMLTWICSKLLEYLLW